MEVCLAENASNLWKCLKSFKMWLNLSVLSEFMVWCCFWTEGTFDAYQRMINAESFSGSLMESNSHREPLGDFERQLLWALSALVALVIIGGMIISVCSMVTALEFSKMLKIFENAWNLWKCLKSFKMLKSFKTFCYLVPLGMVCLWETKIRGPRSSGSSKLRQPASSETAGESENEPLIAQHFGALRYLWGKQYAAGRGWICSVH